MRMRQPSPDLDHLLHPVRRAASVAELPTAMPSPDQVPRAIDILRGVTSPTGFRAVTSDYYGAALNPAIRRSPSDALYAEFDRSSPTFVVEQIGLEGQRFRNMALEIDRFLLIGRISNDPGYALTRHAPDSIDTPTTPEDRTASNLSPLRYAATIASQTPVELDAIELHPVRVVAGSLEPPDALASRCEPPGIQRLDELSVEAMLTDEVIPKVYQALLGPDAVFQTNKQWNVATASGVIEMQSQLKLNNLTITMLSNMRGTYVYFAEDLDPHTGGAPRLHIQNLMEGKSVIQVGALTIVDARRHIRLQDDAAPERSAFVRVNVNAPSTVPSASITAEHAIVEAIRADNHGDTSFERVHVNRLVENEHSCTDMLVTLSEVTNRTVDYAYLRDTGVQLANSPVDTIRGFQNVGVISNKLRNQHIVSHYAGMKMSAVNLLAPDVLSPLAKGLQHADTDSEATAKLTYQCVADYLDLLGAFVAEEILSVKAVWDALKTPEGQHFTSMLGRRAGHQAPLGTSLVGLLDQMRSKELKISSITSVLAAAPQSELIGFFRELGKALKEIDKPPHAEALKKALINRQYISASSLGRSRPLYFRKIFERPFGLMKPDYRTRHPWSLDVDSAQRQAPAALIPSNGPKAAAIRDVLDRLRTNLSHDAIVKMAQTNFRDQLRVRMPTMPMRAQYAFRGLITSSMDDAWRKELPGQRPPSALVSSVLHEVGPGFANRITESRKVPRDKIIEDAVAALGTYLHDHPAAPLEQLRDAYQAILDEALPAYYDLVGFTSETSNASDTSNERHAAYAAGEASTSAAAIKAQRHAQAASLATATAAAHRASKREAEAYSTRASQRAAQESKARSEVAALARAKAVVRETAAVSARLAKDRAEKKAVEAAREKSRKAASASSHQATLNQQVTNARLRAGQPASGTLSSVSSMTSLFSWGAGSVSSTEAMAASRGGQSHTGCGSSNVLAYPAVPSGSLGSHRLASKSTSPLPTTS